MPKKPFKHTTIIQLHKVITKNLPYPDQVYTQLEFCSGNDFCKDIKRINISVYLRHCHNTFSYFISHEMKFNINVLSPLMIDLILNKMDNTLIITKDSESLLF